MKRDGDPGGHAANKGFHHPNMEKQFHETLVSQTNLYRQQSQPSNPSPMAWSDVTVEELMAFIGLVIAMGITNLPEVQDY